MASSLKEGACRHHGALEIGNFPIELLFVDGFQNFSHGWSRAHAEFEQMAPEKYGARRTMFDTQCSGPLEKPAHRFTVERARLPSEAIRFRQACQQFEVDFLSQPPKGAVAHFVADLEPHPRLQMVRRHAEHLMAHIVAVNGVNVEPI